MTAPVDLDRLVLVGEAAGEDEEDTRLLAEGLEQARRYVESFPWCERVVRHWLGDGVGGVFTVSLAEIEPARDDVDRWLWLVVGDLPPLYLTAVDLPTARAALECYVELAGEWVDAVRQGHPTDDLIPVNVPPTPEWADELDRRLRMLERDILAAEDEPPRRRRR